MESIEELKQEVPESACSCIECRGMCERRPCWGTPEDARKIIEAGQGHKLMVDYWTADEDIHILSPAIVGYEGDRAPFWPEGRCTFLTEEGLCSLHDAGLKPLEGRLAIHTGSPHEMHEIIAKTWDTPEGHKLVEEWRANRKRR